MSTSKLNEWLASGSAGVMGSIDRSNFDFNLQFSDYERLILLQTNPTISMATQWVSQESLKHGFLFHANNDVNQKLLKMLNLKTEIIKAITWARLFGESLLIFSDSKYMIHEELPQKKKEERYSMELEPTEITITCKAYHKYVPGVGGWEIQKQDLDSKGEPFQITYHQVTNAVGNIESVVPIKIPKSRVVWFKNPQLTNSWHGTSSVNSLLHMAQIENLILRMISKRAMVVGTGMFVVKGVTNESEASRLHTILNGGMADEIILKNPNITIDYVNPSNLGNANFKELFEILASYQARGMRVSRQAMDGAPEGTLSSSTTNMSFSYSTIEEVQNTFESAITQTFEKLGIHDEWEYVNPVTDVSEESSESTSAQHETPGKESSTKPNSKSPTKSE